MAKHSGESLVDFSHDICQTSGAYRRGKALDDDLKLARTLIGYRIFGGVGVVSLVRKKCAEQSGPNCQRHQLRAPPPPTSTGCILEKNDYTEVSCLQYDWGQDLIEYVQTRSNDSPFERFLKDEGRLGEMASSPWIARTHKF
jgi:hypothetical protein